MVRRGTRHRGCLSGSGSWHALCFPRQGKQLWLTDTEAGSAIHDEATTANRQLVTHDWSLWAEVWYPGEHQPAPGVIVAIYRRFRVSSLGTQSLLLLGGGVFSPAPCRAESERDQQKLVLLTV